MKYNRIMQWMAVSSLFGATSITACGAGEGGDGDGDSAGDGDGDTGNGDGDGDTGDGDGDTGDGGGSLGGATGDGDGDLGGATGDGDGDTATGGMNGDGDGDPSGSTLDLAGSCQQTSINTCIEWFGSVYNYESVQAACMGATDVASEDACPTADKFGACYNVQVEGAAESVSNYYGDDASESIFQNICEVTGVWTSY
jgi:hypothetical protein